MAGELGLTPVAAGAWRRHPLAYLVESGGRISVTASSISKTLSA